ncbi:MAG TPA: hypothetical protein VMV91_06465 [Rhodocyclaceae bacterium]|nr:hypothetical protein [Rhodocyclaceae bacterium]
MKFDLTLHHSGIARHPGQASALSRRVSAVLGRAKEWLFAEWHPLSDEEAYLAQAQNEADLERRLLVLQDPRTRQSFW